MRPLILTLSLLGVILFGGAFGLSFADPLLIERAAREAVRIEVERRVGERIDTLSNSRIAGLAQRTLEKTDLDIEQASRAIRDEIPRRVAGVVAEMLDPDCECRKRLLGKTQRSETERLTTLIQVRERLVALAQEAYASVTNQLMRELRIFTGSNFVAFALLGMVAIVRRRATLQLALPALVLVGAVLITGSLHLFAQDWLHTVVFGEYVGLAYAGYLAAVVLLLADVVFNRARLTTRLVNLALDAMGSAVVAVPC